MTRKEKRAACLITILDVIRQLGSSTTREFEYGMDQDHGIGPQSTLKWLKKFEKEGVIKSEKQGTALIWSAVKATSNRHALDEAGVYAEGKEWIRASILHHLSRVPIKRWASLPGDTILQSYSIEAWILKNNPGASGYGAEKDGPLFKKIKKALKKDNPSLLLDFDFQHESFDETLERLQRAEARLDFTFADYCGGVSPVERETIKTAFEITRSGGVVVVTSGLSYRGAGGYWELYGHDEDNARCLAIELEEAAYEAAVSIHPTATLPYKSAKNKDMFALIFKVK